LAEPIETKRRLAAIFAADVEGYSRLMGADEVATLDALAARREILDGLIATHGGRIANTAGDSVLAEFGSAVDAVRCAMEAQGALATANSTLPESRHINFRIGVHVGDVMVRAGDLFGDGVNIAARLQTLAKSGGLCISSVTYDQVRKILPLSFTDLGAQTVKNIEEPIRAYEVRAQGEAASISKAPGLVRPPIEKPSIAVLSFTNMTGDSDQEYFGDGIAEDIITMLSRSHLLFVIARNSTFVYKSRTVDVKQIARELDVRYVLEGSVRRGGDRVRITAQLIDAETGNHLWAERYDRDPADIFVVQDEITEAVVTAIIPAVARMEQRRAVRRPLESLGSWEAYQRGLWHAGRIGATENEAAKTFFRRAIDLNPNFGPAHAELANAILTEAWLYQTRSMVEVLDEAIPVAQKAISLDPLDAVARCAVGLGRFFLGDHDGALVAARQALSISPNYAQAHHNLGLALVFSGQPRGGIEALRMAMRLDPNDLLRQLRWAQISMGHYFLREYDAAVEAAKEAVRSSPGLGPRSLAAALGQAGRLDEAKQALQTAIAAAPKSFDMYVRQRAPWFRPEDYDHVLEGLRKAGWEG
jgi:adenylate cyclase